MIRPKYRLKKIPLFLKKVRSIFRNKLNGPTMRRTTTELIQPNWHNSNPIFRNKKNLCSLPCITNEIYAVKYVITNKTMLTFTGL